MEYKLFMTCPRGFEDMCRNELDALGATNLAIDNGGVHLMGSLSKMYEMNYKSRLGMNLLWEINEFKCLEMLTISMRGIYHFDWSEYITTVNSFAVNVAIKKSTLITNSHYAKLKVKDAIVDYFRDNYDQRPEIDKVAPDIPLFIFINDKSVKIYINSSGEPLFKRNYRDKIHKAALNEVSAAGLIQMSGWHEELTDLHDPMCGSGTIPIEASMLLYNIPSGFLRKSYAFMKWQSYNNTLFNDIINESKDNIITKQNIKIIGSDISRSSIELFTSSVKKYSHIKVDSFVRNVKYFRGSDLYVISNPPYGLRIGENEKLEKLYSLIEQSLLNRNVNTFLLIEDGPLLEIFKSDIVNKYHVMNGGIKCLFIKLNT